MKLNPWKLVSIKPANMIVIVIAIVLSVFSVSYYGYAYIGGLTKFRNILSFSNLAIGLYLLAITWQWSIYNAFTKNTKSLLSYLINLFLFYLAIFWFSFAIYLNVTLFGQEKVEHFLMPTVLSQLAYYSYILISFIVAKIIVIKECRSTVHFFDYLGTAIQVIIFPFTFYRLQERVYKLRTEAQANVGI